MHVIISISHSFGVLKLCHLKHVIRVLILHFVEILTMRVIMSHGTGTSVPPRVLADIWRLFVTQHFVLLCDVICSYLAIVVANNIAYGRSWPVWSSIWVSLLRQINRLFLDLEIKSGKRILTLVASKCRLCSRCSRSGPQRISISDTVIVLVSRGLAIVMRRPNGSYYRYRNKLVCSN